MDIFKTIKDGIAAMRAGNHVQALIHLSEALGLVLKGLQPEAVEEGLAASPQTQASPAAGQDDEAAVLARMESKAATLQQAGAAPSGAGAAPAAGLNLVGLLPDLLLILDLIRRRLGH